MTSQEQRAALQRKIWDIANDVLLEDDGDLIAATMRRAVGLARR